MLGEPLPLEQRVAAPLALAPRGVPLPLPEADGEVLSERAALALPLPAAPEAVRDALPLALPR